MRPTAFAFVHRPSPATAPVRTAADPSERLQTVKQCEGRQKDLLHEIRLQQERVTDAHQCLTETKRAMIDIVEMQNQLCEEEKFEEADRLNADLDTLRTRLTEKTSEIAGAPQKISDLLSRLVDAGHATLKAVQEADAALQGDLKKSEDERTRVEEEQTAELKRQTQEAATMTEERGRLEALQTKQRERRVNFEKNRKHVVEKVEVETKDLCVQKERLMQTADELDTEIRELEETLKRKRQQRQNLTVEIVSAEAQIDKIHGKFAHEFSHFEPERASLEAAEKEMGVRLELLRKDEDAMKARTDHFLKEAHRVTDLLAQVQDCLTSVNNYKHLLTAVLPLRDTFAQQISDLLVPILALTGTNEHAAEQAVSLAMQADEKETEITRLRQRLGELRERMPQLEMEKKNAIASRAFKAAKEISDEQKFLTEETGDVEKRLSSLRSEIASLQERRNALASEQQDFFQNLVSAQSDMEIAQTKILKIFIEELCRLVCVRELQPFLETEMETWKFVYVALCIKHGLEPEFLDERIMSADPLAVPSETSETIEQQSNS